MSKIKIDIDKVESIGQDIKRLNKEYQNLIEELMQKINSITDNGIWTGTSANNYLSSITTTDKKNYMYLASVINHYGDFLINSASETRRTVVRAKL